MRIQRPFDFRRKPYAAAKVCFKFSNPPKETPAVLVKARNLVRDGLADDQLLVLAMRVPLLRAMHTYWNRKLEASRDDILKTQEVSRNVRWEKAFAEVLQGAEKVLLQALFVKKNAPAVDQALENIGKAMQAFETGNLTPLLAKVDYLSSSMQAPCDQGILQRWRRLALGVTPPLAPLVRKSLVTFGVGHLLSGGKKWDAALEKIYFFNLAHMNRSILDGVDPELLSEAVYQLAQQLTEFVASKA